MYLNIKMKLGFSYKRIPQSRKHYLHKQEKKSIITDPFQYSPITNSNTGQYKLDLSNLGFISIFFFWQKSIDQLLHLEHSNRW